MDSNIIQHLLTALALVFLYRMIRRESRINETLTNHILARLRNLEPESNQERLAKAAENVAAELISYIDSDQKWQGWAHAYKDHFKYDPKAYPTLNHALNDLRDAIAEGKPK